MVRFWGGWLGILLVGWALPGFGMDPVARLTGPNTALINHEINLNFIGTVSEEEPEYEVALAPPGANVEIAPLYSRDQNLTYGVVIPDKIGLYRFALIASAPDPTNKGKIKRKYAFLDVNVLDQIGPLPGPPPQPQPGPSPQPQPGPSPQPQPEKYGLYTLSKKWFATLPATTASGWKAQAGQLGDIFLQVSNDSSSYRDPQTLVQDTVNKYKQLLGANYPVWKQYFFTPLLTKLTELATKGQLPSTVPVHQDAWREIGVALKEVAQ